MEESRALPARLGILPFPNKVLLPGAIAKIECTSASSIALIEELSQREGKSLIGVLPVWDANAAKTPLDGSLLSPGQHETSDPCKLDHESIHWHTRGVAARVLHLSRGMGKPSGRVAYTVVLEGLRRFSVQEMSTTGAYCIARIEGFDLDETEMKLAAHDSDIIMLSLQFKATAMQLISILEQKVKSVGQSKILFETLPAHRLADIFVASLDTSFDEQLFLLDTVDVKKRLIKVTQLVGRHLQLIRIAEEISQKVQQNLSRSQKEYLLREQRVLAKRIEYVLEHAFEGGWEWRHHSKL